MTMTRIGELVTRAVEALLALMLAVMMLMLFGNVILRYGFNSGIVFSEEASRILFVWLTFIGAVLAMKEHAHLGIDTLVRMLPPAGKKVCAVASSLLMLYANYLLFTGGWTQTLINMDAAAPVTGVPMAIMYVPALVTSVGISALLLLELYRIAFGKGTEQDLVLVKGTEEGTVLDEAGHMPAGKSPGLPNARER